MMPKPGNFKHPKNIRFECEKCALCCGDTDHKDRTILLMKTEARSISKKTLKSIEEFTIKTPGCKPYEFRMKKNSEGKCVFLADTRCTIYEFRPLICKFYPFEFKETENGLHEFFPSTECPSMGKGSRLTRPYFEKLVNELVNTIRKNGIES